MEKARRSNGSQNQPRDSQLHRIGILRVVPAVTRFSVLAVGVAIGLYFLLRPYVGTETVSWMCILGAAPFAAMGFVSYHGMTAEQFLWAWLRSEILEPKEIIFEPVNLYYEMTKKNIKEHEKELMHDDEKH